MQFDDFFFRVVHFNDIVVVSIIITEENSRLAGDPFSLLVNLVKIQIDFKLAVLGIEAQSFEDTGEFHFFLGSVFDLGAVLQSFHLVFVGEIDNLPIRRRVVDLFHLDGLVVLREVFNIVFFLEKIAVFFVVSSDFDRFPDQVFVDVAFAFDSARITPFIDFNWVLIHEFHLAAFVSKNIGVNGGLANIRAIPEGFLLIEHTMGCLGAVFGTIDYF